MFPSDKNATSELSYLRNPEELSIPVQQERRGLGWMWWVVLLAILAFVGWRILGSGVISSQHANGDFEKSLAVPVSVAPVTTEDFPIYLDGLGTVQAYNSVQVNARVAGQIQEIRFQEGQDVKQGDVIAVIDPQTYQAQYDQAVSKQAQDEAQLQSAQVLLGRDQDLINKAVLDKQSYDTQKFLVAQLQAAVQADAANVEQQKTQLDWTQVTAPISGRTGVRQLDVGNQVNIGGNGMSNSSTIVVINQIKPIFVSFTLPQQDLEQIRAPMLAHKPLEVIALDRNNRTVLSTGTLTVIDNQIDTSTATVKLKATFANEDYQLWPGQFVNVRLLVGDTPNAVVVPSSAVQLGPDGSYVYVVGADKKVSMRTVTTGPTEEGMILIQSGLAPNETVVIDGQYRLQPDSMVSIAAAKSTASQPESSGAHDQKAP